MAEVTTDTMVSLWRAKDAYTKARRSYEWYEARGWKFPIGHPKRQAALDAFKMAGDVYREARSRYESEERS
jgi:hypothetical protein